MVWRYLIHEHSNELKIMMVTCVLIIYYDIAPEVPLSTSFLAEGGLSRELIAVPLRAQQEMGGTRLFATIRISPPIFRRLPRRPSIHFDTREASLDRPAW